MVEAQGIGTSWLTIFDGAKRNNAEKKKNEKARMNY